jgi:transposase InsO family protein
VREAGIRAKRPRRFRRTTDSRHALPIAPNLVERRFDELASTSNKLWVSELTYVCTWQGWVYPCVFLDVFSRKVVG